MDDAGVKAEKRYALYSSLVKNLALPSGEIDRDAKKPQSMVAIQDRLIAKCILFLIHFDASRMKKQRVVLHKILGVPWDYVKKLHEYTPTCLVDSTAMHALQAKKYSYRDGLIERPSHW